MVQAITCRNLFSSCVSKNRQTDRILVVMTESPAALVRGLFETHLHVANLERAMGFYGDVLGLELGLKETERRAALYWIGRNRSAMLGIWEKPPWVAGGAGKQVAPQHL